MSASVAPFAVQSGEGTRLETPTGDWVTITAHTRNTNGSMSVLEVTSEPKSGPALHIHLREDELWWVLEGEYRFKAGFDWFGKPLRPTWRRSVQRSQDHSLSSFSACTTGSPTTAPASSNGCHAG
jgi:hypothetical protein